MMRRNTEPEIVIPATVSEGLADPSFYEPKSFHTGRM